MDHLRHFADCLTLDEAIPFCIEDLTTLSRNWIGRGYNVVLSWPISGRSYAGIFERLKDVAPMHCFTLRPRLEVALSDRGGRQLTDRERSRIREQYGSPHISPGLGVVIDNSDITLEQTAHEIMSHLPLRTDS